MTPDESRSTVRTLALTISAVAALAVVIGLASFAIDSDPWTPGSAALISIGLVMCTVTAVTGFLLVRAPWGRWGLVGCVIVAMLLALATESEAWILTVCVGIVAVVGLAGPWLRLWLRRLPSADGPNRVAMSLMLVAPTAPLVVGLAAHNQSHWLEWVAAGTGVGSSFAYARGIPGAIWLLRLGFPAAGIAAAFASPMPWAILMVAFTVSVAVMAWLPDARRVVTTPAPVLPQPRPGRKRTVDANE